MVRMRDMVPAPNRAVHVDKPVRQMPSMPKPCLSPSSVTKMTVVMGPCRAQLAVHLA